MLQLVQGGTVHFKANNHFINNGLDNSRTNLESSCPVGCPWQGPGPEMLLAEPMLLAMLPELILVLVLALKGQDVVLIP